MIRITRRARTLARASATSHIAAMATRDSGPLRQVPPMSKTISTAFALLFGSLLFATTPARAADTDRALLSTFCAPADIQGSTCKRAKGYPNAGRSACDVTLNEDRYSGKFLPSG